MTRVTGTFWGSWRLVSGKSPTWIILCGSRGDVSGFQTIATCRDGLKVPMISRQQARRGNWAIADVRDKIRGSRRHRGQINGDVTGLSQTCRGRHREVGIVEFGL